MHADVEIPRTSRTEWFLFASVLLVALAVRLVLFVGIVRLDMFRYLEMSNHVLSGGSLFDKTVYYYSGRLALVGPLFLFNRIFGFSELASVLWPLLCSLASVTGVFFIGRELYGSRVGLLAALGMALVPLQVELGTQLLPDPIEGGFLVLAVLFGIFAITRDRGWRWWAIGSGAALALAYFTRVNAIIFLPGILVIGAILKPSRWRRSLWALAGVVGALAGAAVIFWALSGDPLVDWHRTAQFYSSYAGTGFVFREQRFWRQMLNVRQYATAWLLPVLALGTSWALARRQRASWLMLVWAYAFWIYLDVISPLHGLDTSYRYVEPMSAPALLLFAGGIVWLGARLPKRVSWIPLALAVVLFLGMLPFDRSVVRGWRNNRRWQSMRMAAEYAMANRDGASAYVVGPYTAFVVNYYGGFTFGRDTLAPLDAPVNAGARLFEQGERKPAPGESALWISEWTPPAEYRAKEVASYRGISRPLRVFEITAP